MIGPNERCPLAPTAFGLFVGEAHAKTKCADCATPEEYESCTTFMVACLSRSQPIMGASRSDFQYK